MLCNEFFGRCEGLWFSSYSEVLATAGLEVAPLDAAPATTPAPGVAVLAAVRGGLVPAADLSEDVSTSVVLLLQHFRLKAIALVY